MKIAKIFMQLYCLTLIIALIRVGMGMWYINIESVAILMWVLSPYILYIVIKIRRSGDNEFI